MREQLVSLILERLGNDTADISKDFHTYKGINTRFAVIDDLLPKDIAVKFAAAFRH